MNWPGGVRSAGVSAGIKSDGGLDLGLIAAPGPVSWAGVFTQNAAAAAPVEWCRSLKENQIHAIVVNSGNANACTGDEGMLAVEATARRAADVVGCDISEVLVASTGPIGVQLPVQKVIDALPYAHSQLGRESKSFAESILTTDTTTKTASATVGEATIFGVAKGAAMVAPNMATMLAFIATDAKVVHEELQSSLRRAVDDSFNRISIDGCISTNDSVFLLTTGDTEVSARDFDSALGTVCKELADQIVTDAEGGTKVMRVIVEGARDNTHADELARAVASSALWRSAAYGNDANWGRIVSALGGSDPSLDASLIKVQIGKHSVYPTREPEALAAASTTMASARWDVTCSVGNGRGQGEIITCDLSPAYVELNAGGST